MKLLVIRFSSFGDIVQAIAVPEAFRAKFPGASVDWLTREDFADLLKQQPTLDHVISFPRASGLSGLLRLSLALSRANYTHVYDAHSNLRSGLLRFVLQVLRPRLKIAVRPKNRVRRFLFFRLRLKSVLPRPFRGADSFHAPLVKWGLSPHVPAGLQFHLRSTNLPADVSVDIASLRGPLIAVAASAAWEMKRWPIEHWATLIKSMSEFSFLLLGGPEDRFLDELRAIDPSRVLNLAGRLTLDQSSAALLRASLVISNDTGVLHVADQMERPAIALIGPTAFGYPSHATSLTLERPLWCQPCSKDGRGGCKNDLYKRCLIELTPREVETAARAILERA